jgi:RNA polymerase sigma factor (sigma-70 family)
MTDPLSDYLAAITKFPLLTAEQEIQLGRQVARYMELRNAPGERTKQELRQIKIGIRARDTIVKSNLRLVVHAAKKYSNCLKSNNMELIDLIQEGAFGLQRAAELFDPSRGYKFSTYSYWWIRQSISRAIYNNERLVKIPQRVLDKLYQATKAEAEFVQVNGRTPTRRELAAIIGITAEELATLVNYNAPHASLNQSFTDDGNCIIDLIADPNVPDEMMTDEYSEQLQLAFFYLSDSDREVIARRYGLNGEAETLTAIAQDRGVSRERVRQQTEVAKNKLKLLMTK